MNTTTKNINRLSVVVIGRNEGERLTRCLMSITPLYDTYKDLELIYVDSASTDDSINRAKAFTENIILLNSANPSASKARNAGWKKSKNQFILFLDGDTMLDPEFVSVALPYFDNPKVAILCGNLNEIKPKETIFNRIFNLDWNSPSGIVEACGGNACIRKKVLEEIDGFDETLPAGEEPEMCQRIRVKGYIIVKIDQLIGLHDLHMNSFSQYWKRCMRTGYAYAEIAHRNGYERGKLWTRESVHNLIKGSIMLDLLVISLAFLPFNFKPVLFVMILFTILVLRSFYLSKTKSPSFIDRFLYSIHTHLQHIPMLFGQIKYWIIHK